MSHVVCAGLVTVDFIYHTAHFPVEGTKMRAGSTQMVAGGGALYAASAIASLGGEASLAGAIGEDALAPVVRAGLKAAGVDGSCLRALAGVGTARSAVIISEGGERTVVNHRDEALFADAPLLPPSFDAALADTRWPTGALALMEAARKAGKPGVLDAESPVRLAEAALRAASHVVFSEQGLRDYAGGSDVAALAQAAGELGVWVAVTRGERPVLWHDGQTGGEVATFPTQALDTLGAGDAWHGAFTLALARGQDEIAAARFANAAASVKVRQLAGQMPDALATAALLNAG